MGTVTSRTGLTSRGMMALSSWLGDGGIIYGIVTIYLGNNPISKLEVVSALNSFNLGRWEYHFKASNCITKYNPKVYLGTVQTASKEWLYNVDSGLSSDEKSGSLTLTKNK